MPNDKKFLRRQVYEISQLEKCGFTGNQSLDEKPEVHEVLEKKYNKKNLIKDKERKIIYEILDERINYLGNRAIVGDIVLYTKKEGGKDLVFIKYTAKYGLKMDIFNLNSFLDFCSMHAFIPMIDNIIINDQNANELTEIFELFNLALFCKDRAIANILRNEISKIEASFQQDIIKLLDRVQNISRYINYSYQYLSGKNLDRLKNDGIISENIFAEIALSLENHIRDKLQIESSYIKVGGHEQDLKEKTDLNFLLRKTKKQPYLQIPIQLTINSGNTLEKKEKGVETYLFNCLRDGKKLENNFVILSINGEFKNYMNKTIDEKNRNIQIVEDYKSWLNNPTEREKSVGGKFPLFKDTLDDNIVKPAEIIYIALHMLYKKYDFKNTNKENYINACKKIGRIDRFNKMEINGINLCDIEIYDSKILKINRDDCGDKDILKHKYEISYKKDLIGCIIIYGI